MIDELDETEWRQELDSKTSLGLYRNFKREMREEIFYDNTEESILMFRAV